MRSRRINTISFFNVVNGSLLVSYSAIYKIDCGERNFGNGVTLPYRNFTAAFFYRKPAEKSWPELFFQVYLRS